MTISFAVPLYLISEKDERTCLSKEHQDGLVICVVALVHHQEH